MNKIMVENTDYEFKEALEIQKPKSWLKTISAFANGQGGTLFFGVNDDGEVVGIDNPKNVIEKISEMIKARIEPIPVFIIKSEEKNNLIYVEVTVLTGPFTPYYYHSDGNKIVYVRSGDETIEAPSYILNELILKGMGQTYDSILTNENKDDYAFTYLKSKYLNKTNLRLNEEDFISFGLCHQGYLTRAGLLLADMNNLLQCRIFCTRWNGVDKLSEETVLNDLEVQGSILIQLDRALEFLKANTNTRWHKDGKGTVYEPDYDEEAVEEALVNAIIHRDYNVIGAEVVLNIYNDRLEITSPGGMYSGKTIPTVVQTIMESKRRNPVIADIFHRMHLMNRRGSGLANITNRTNKLFNDNKNHVFYKSDSEFFSVTIENANYKKENEIIDLTQREQEVVDIIKDNTIITASDIAKHLNVSRSTIIRITNKLVANKIIERFGSNKKGFWKALI